MTSRKKLIVDLVQWENTTNETVLQAVRIRQDALG